MDKFSSGMKKLTTQVQVNYQHNQHKELATAIYEEKNVVDSIKKITAAKIAGKYNTIIQYTKGHEMPSIC